MTLRYYCETCRVGVEEAGIQCLCSRCHNGLLDLATEQAWDYLSERGQSLHDQRQRFIAGFSALALSVPGCLLIYLRMDSWEGVLDYLYDFRFYIGSSALVTVCVASLIATKRWPPDPILSTSVEDRVALRADSQ